MQIEQNEGQWTRLPINQRRRDIIKAIQENDVVVVEGETGCGKTTQVPKYILDAWPDSRVIVTQPRRLAAISVATRVAHQTNSKLGGKIGYHIGMDCKATDKTSITYVTNGIFLQKLTNDSEFFKSYSHFIFDEIHERGLDCDFSLIAMKLHLCRQANTKCKIVLMSATLNSQLFSRFFAKNQLGCFVKSKIVEERDQAARGRYSRGDTRGGREQQRDVLKEWKYTTRLNITSEDKPAICIKLASNRRYAIHIKYLEDVDRRKQYQGYSEQPDLDDKLFETATKVINDSVKHGDVLVFVPGMRQIKRMSDCLQQHKNIYNIVELHSHYSETAYEQLFSKNAKPKIIISTNIAESSITLPDCKTVVDFCMSKQNYYDEKTRFQRLELRWASKASITQRAGRVGRVSDGTVIRLIPRSFLERLGEYESPQIRRSPLEKTILQIKKLEQLDIVRKRNQYGQGSVFANPYEVLSNAFQPPEINAINAAIDRLVQELALTINKGDAYDDPEFKSMNYNGNSLKITKLGELLVQIPCDIQLAKALLLSMELGCLPQMLNIAAILYSKKPFFINSQKRPDPQQYIHNLLYYDGGDYNDFKIRERIIAEWKKQFYDPWFKNSVNRYFSNKRMEDIDNQDQNLYEVYENRVVNYTKMLNDFQRTRATKEELNWCRLRCVYTNNLREILTYREGLRFRIVRGRFNYRQDFINNIKIQDMAVDICLFAAFRDSLMLIENTNEEASGLNSFLNQGLKPELSLDVDFQYDQNQNEIQKYIKPEKGITNIIKMSKSFFIEATLPILSKFMLPYRHKGRLTGESGCIFRMLFNKQPYYPYKMRVKDMKHRSQVKVDNDSINGFIPHRGYHEGYLLSNGYFETRTSLTTSCTAYLSSTFTILLLMIFSDSCELVHHDSHEFFNKLKTKGFACKLPIFIDEEVIKLIDKLKIHIVQIFELQQRQTMSDDLIRDFRSVLDQDYQAIPNTDMQWEQQFIEQKFKRVHVKSTQNVGGIQFANIDPRIKKDRAFHRNYDSWRRQQIKNFEMYVNKLRFDSAKFICRDCYPQKTQVLCEAESCNGQTFRYHPYDDSWHLQGKEIMCSAKKHRIGKQISEQQVELDSQAKVMLFYPDLSTSDFSFKRFNLRQVKQIEEQALRQMRQFRRNARNFQCMFCAGDGNPYTARNLQQFMKHTRNKDHYRKLQDFGKGLN